MSINIHILTASQKVKPFETELKGVAESAATSVKKLLPIKDVDIVFYDNPQATFTDGEFAGIGGFTPNQHTIFISLNPLHENFKNAIKDPLLFTLIHELHHTIRWQKPVEGDTLLEAMVFEGLADHFAMQVTGRKTPTMYSNALTPSQKKKLSDTASKEWEQPSYNHNEWFYGSNHETIPRWTGYTLGYDLVTNYLKTHPGTQASELTSVDASIFKFDI